jgi:uncharacterized damage-inducible protein DinB
MTEQELQEKLHAIETNPARVAAAVSGVDTDTLRYKPAPNKWSIMEIVGHLADMEVMFAYRMRQMLADKNPTIAPIDQDDWARNLRYQDGDLDLFLNMYQTGRRANLRLLRRLTVADLDKGAFHPELDRNMTVNEIVGRMAAHDPNHLGQIERLKQQARAAQA